MRARPSQPTSRAARAWQRGVTLVELMVSIAIGLFIVLVATTIYVRGLSTVNFRVGQSENLNNSRYALNVLDNELTKAGYRRDPTQDIAEAFPADGAANATNACQFDVGQAIYAPDDKSLCLRYQARDDAETDCGGAAAGLGAFAGPYVPPAAGTGLFVERYTLSDGSLVCQSGQATTSAVQVADGVRDVHFEFGIDDMSDPSKGRHVSAYKTAVPASHEVIRSLRYAILMNSTGKVTQGMASTVCSRWAEAGGTATSCNADGSQLYQLASGSLTLRNLMP
ncbi:prepilin-type N-terminal cleavage/methylation domain-containing protein [Diaphorobacter caeni]|uniref:prepilin-type N-terminal cleavage/methylation domain-containing protein n=1 Tax=Diaphorobacter caeni TaxID=2784387 RepID=UPI00188DFCD7|nr:prepilin-type N-terminal cleavage/methylation domain-containing protein [Diaphorobacter caeni]MBF5005086.1 PilW family protein [Diaphorobacter caeni]